MVPKRYYVTRLVTIVIVCKNIIILEKSKNDLFFTMIYWEKGRAGTHDIFLPIRFLFIGLYYFITLL